jgi:tetratricopeptide (TPR) repeat protein
VAENTWLPRSCWAKCWKRSRKLTKLTVPVPNLWPLTPITCQLTFVWQIFPRTRRVWNKVLQLSTRALEIDPTNDAVAYDYNAAANFHLHRLPEAEKGALRAAEIDKSNADPRVHFLLAQIYEAKGGRQSEAAQLREYLKYASDPNDVAMVKRYLSELETDQTIRFDAHYVEWPLQSMLGHYGQSIS